MDDRPEGMSEEAYQALCLVWSTIKSEQHFRCEICGVWWVAFNGPPKKERCHVCWPCEN